MPIEFPCPQCNSLLRTPDSSVGKKAKCPKCGAIADVPAASSRPEETLPVSEEPGDNPFEMAGGLASSPPASPMPKPPSPESANPFAEATDSPFRVQKPTDTENPYATPSTPMDTYAAPPQAGAALTPTRIEFGDTLQVSWKVYSDNLGVLLLMALILIGLVVLGYAAVVGVMLAFFFSMMSGNADPTMMIVAIPIVLVLAIVALVAYSWIEAGLAIVTVGLCRGSRVQIGDMFSGGRFTLQVVILNIIRGVINLVISFGCAMLGQALVMAANEPGLAFVGSLLANILNYVITLVLLLTTYFIVDRNMDVIQSISASARYMRGNKLIVFGIHIVCGLCAVLAVLFSCGIGGLFVVPFFLVLTAMIYLLATGQPIARYARQTRPGLA